MLLTYFDKIRTKLQKFQQTLITCTRIMQYIDLTLYLAQIITQIC